MHDRFKSNLEVGRSNPEAKEPGHLQKDMGVGTGERGEYGFQGRYSNAASEELQAITTVNL